MFKKLNAVKKAKKKKNYHHVKVNETQITRKKNVSIAKKYKFAKDSISEKEKFLQKFEEIAGIKKKFY